MIKFVEGQINQKILRSVSVGFRPLVWEFAKGRKNGINFLENELLEISVVSIPANSNALLVGTSDARKRAEQAKFEARLKLRRHAP